MDKAIEKANKADKIVKGLYLGDELAAEDIEFFKKNRIGAVLNCTTDVPNHFRRSNVEYMRIPVEDNLRENQINKMTLYMPHACSFIYKNLNIEHKNVLIHCHAGMQRSAAVVLYYLMKVGGMKKRDAIRLMRSKRGIVFHGGAHINFEKALHA